MDAPANPLHPKIRSVWRMAGVACALGFAAGPIGIAIGLRAPVIALAALLGVPFVVAVPDAMYRRWRYEIRDRDVYLSHGVLFHDTVVVPFDRIQFAETRQGPLDRYFKLAQVVIYTAGGKHQIPGLEPAEAERLREHLASVAGSLSV